MGVWRGRDWRGKIPRERECVWRVRESRERGESELRVSERDSVCVGFCGELRGA